MDLIHLDKSSRNTVFVDEHSGTAVYSAETESSMWTAKPTKILKFKGDIAMEMAHIEMHSFHSDIVRVWDKDITPQREKWYSSKSFVASDGVEYKWKEHAVDFSLIRTDGNGTPVAYYKAGNTGIIHKKREPKLSISPDGLRIADEIVASFIYALQVQKANRRNAAAASSASASSSAAVAAAC